MEPARDQRPLSQRDQTPRTLPPVELAASDPLSLDTSFHEAARTSERAHGIQGVVRNLFPEFVEPSLRTAPSERQPFDSLLRTGQRCSTLATTGAGLLAAGGALMTLESALTGNASGSMAGAVLMTAGSICTYGLYRLSSYFTEKLISYNEVTSSR